MSAADSIRSFKLSDSFLDEYRDSQPAWGYNGLGYVVYKRTYARTKQDGTLEEFWETCKRVVEGTYDVQKKHCKALRLPWDDRKAQRSAQEMYRRMWAFKWLPPGRGLWMMGSPSIERLGGAALNNCFSGDTEAVVINDDLSLASVPLRDLVGREFITPLPSGIARGTVKAFGEQELNHVTFKVPGRSKYVLEYAVTADHRWILADGSSTTSLKLGDRVTVKPRQVHPNFLNTSTTYQRGFAHGLIYGDGTRHTYYPERHFIRLCGEKEQAHRKVLEALPEYVSTTMPKSYGGDSVVTLKLNKGENWKQIPDETKDVLYCRGFIDGWLAADGHTEPSGNKQLDSINLEGVEWLTKLAPTCGYTVTGWSVENADTNFGPRSKPLNRVTLSTAPVDLIVQSIEPVGRQEVFCAVVPDANTFVLAGGLETGNCGFVSTKGIAVDFADPFCWLMDMLMLGVGVGFDTKGVGLVKIQKPSIVEGTFTVDDSREGWVALLKVYLDAHVGRGAIPETIDYSKVRPAGAPIRGFGGVASGPDPLKELVHSISNTLEPLHGQPITSSAIVDVCNLIGRCVVAGNVRRSAEIAFGDATDSEFLDLKNPEINKEALFHHRWASNNSVFASVGMDYTVTSALTERNGEPGYLWLDNARMFGRMGRAPDFSDMRVAGANPCVEQSLEDRELCCLVETFPGLHDSFEDYKKTLKYAYLYAKTVTLMPTHDDRTNTVMMRNRRIGCSMSGIVQAMQKFGRRDFLQTFCDKGYEYLRELDQVYADWLCVRTSVKVTSVKPSGTVSLLPGVTPGIHYPHAEYYIRRVRLQDTSPLVEKLSAAGYPVETDKYSPNTVVVSFPVQERDFDRSKDDITLWEQLEIAAQMQQYWADNQVSVTVTFKPSEAKDIKHALELYETRLKGVSFLPLENHGYEQAPYETITAEQYESLKAGIIELDTTDAQHELTSRFCDGDTCVIG